MFDQFLGTVAAIVALVLSIIALSKSSRNEKRLERLLKAVAERNKRDAEDTPKNQNKPNAVAAEVPAPEVKKTKAPEPEPVAPNEPPKPKPAREARPQKPSQFEIFFGKLVQNFSENWIFWLSGISLALGGLFLIRYGIEAGYFGPLARVIAAMVFGVLLIGVAEFLRQKQGGQVAWFDLPPTLAGAGLFSLFGATIGAHILYDLLATEPTFIILAIVTLVAVGGGILYGPMLSVIGVLGAYLAPFLLKDGEASAFLLVYFAVIFTATLWIERYMRWAWLSALSAFLAIGAGYLAIEAAQLGMEAHLYAMVLTALAVIVPYYGFVAPPQGHLSLTKALGNPGEYYPILFAQATAILAFGVASQTDTKSELEHLIVLGVLIALQAWLIFVMYRAEPLKWVSMAVGAFSYVILFSGDPDGRGVRAVTGNEVGMVIIFASLHLYGAIWRAERTRRPRVWYWIGGLVPLGSVLWLAWNDTLSFSDGRFASDVQWGLACAVFAVLLMGCSWLTVTSKQRDRRWGGDLYSFGSLISAAFAVLLVLEDQFHTHGMAALALGATALNSVFGYRLTRHSVWVLMTISIAALIAVNSIDLDGLFGQDRLSGFDGLTPHLIYAAALGLFWYGWRFAADRKLPREGIQFETAFLVGLAVYVLAWIDIILGPRGTQSYVQSALSAAVILVLSAAAFYRLNAATHMRGLRYVLAFLYGGVGLIVLAISLEDMPLFEGGSNAAGFVPFDTVTLSYLIPVICLAATSRMASWRKIMSHWLLLGPSLALLGVVIISHIRRIWHGTVFDLNRGFLQPELYTYSVLMMAATGVLVWLALARQSLHLKRYALGLAALTAAKVFLVDMSGMTGLSRATIFMILGAVLGGIAWLLNDLKAPPKDEETA